MQSFTSFNPVLLIGIALLAVVMAARQLQARQLRPARLVLLPGLLLLGLSQQTTALASMNAAGWAFLAVSVAVGGAAGAARAATTRTWTRSDGTTWMQSTRAGLGLWGALIGFRILAGVAAHFAGVSLAATAVESIAMLAVLFAVQNALLFFRTAPEPLAV